MAKKPKPKPKPPGPRYLLSLALLVVALGISCVPARAQPTAIGPANPILCNVGTPVTGTAALAQVLAGVAGKIVVICGWSFTNTAAAGTFLIAQGTGTNCGTNTVNLTPALSVGSSAVTDHSPTAVISSPAGSAICVNATATVTGIIWLAQF